MIKFEMLHPKCTEEHLGWIPDFFAEYDPRPAKEQLHEAYSHGGGWRPLDGWHVRYSDFQGDPTIKYPGDPSMAPIAKAILHEAASDLPTEEIFLFDYAIVMIRQGDGSFEIARVD